MTRAVLFAAFFAVLCAAVFLPVPDLQAKAFDCLDKGKCKPIPCEIMAELKFTKAEVTLYWGHEAPTGMTPQEWSKSRKAALKQAWEQYRSPNCVRSGYVDGNSLSETSCKLESSLQGGAPLTKQESMDKSTVCTELVEADWWASQARLALCRPETVGPKATGEGLRRNLMYAAVNRDATLEEAIKGYLSSCAPDAQQAQELSGLGLDGLLSEAESARTRWQASRYQSSAFDPSPVFDPR